MTVSASEHRQETENTELIAYMSRHLGLGWEDIAKRLPDVSADVIKAIVFCKHVGLQQGQPLEADFPQGTGAEPERDTYRKLKH